MWVLLLPWPWIMLISVWIVNKTITLFLFYIFFWGFFFWFLHHNSISLYYCIFFIWLIVSFLVITIYHHISDILVWISSKSALFVLNGLFFGSLWMNLNSFGWQIARGKLPHPIQFQFQLLPVSFFSSVSSFVADPLATPHLLRVIFLQK